MKRLLFLLSFALFALISTAGYSDSSVDKKASTYQIGLDDNSNDAVTLFGVEKAEFVLNSPDLGVAIPVNTLLSERTVEGYIIPARAPPDNRCGKIRI